MYRTVPAVGFKKKCACLAQALFPIVVGVSAFLPSPHSKPPARPLTDPFFNRTQPRAVPQVVVPALDKALANKKVAKFMLKE